MQLAQYTWYTLPLRYFLIFAIIRFEKGNENISFCFRNICFRPIPRHKCIRINNDDRTIRTYGNNGLLSFYTRILWRHICVRITSERNPPEFHASQRNVNKWLIALSSLFAYNFDGCSLMSVRIIFKLTAVHLFLFWFLPHRKMMKFSPLTRTHYHLIYISSHVLTDRRTHTHKWSSHRNGFASLGHRIISLLYRLHANGNHLTVMSMQTSAIAIVIYSYFFF